LAHIIGERNDRETNLFGTLERGLERRFPFLDVAADIFDHNDGVVDDKAGRNGQRHEGKVVEAIAKKIHHAESAN
jgi:hypothetical protein